MVKSNVHMFTVPHALCFDGTSSAYLGLNSLKQQRALLLFCDKMLLIDWISHSN